MKFAFIAKHRGIWPAGWLCGALGVSRGGFYAWLTRPRSQRSRSNEELGAKVRVSFIASDRTYGARRVWHDMLAEGVSCGLHRIERLMRLQALKARPRRHRLPPDLGERQVAAVASECCRSLAVRERRAPQNDPLARTDCFGRAAPPGAPPRRSPDCRPAQLRAALVTDRRALPVWTLATGRGLILSGNHIRKW